MDRIEKLPRWVLILCTSGFCGLIILISSYLWAQGENTKHVAYQAKSVAETCSLQVADLRGAIQEAKNTSETFRKEYREDQTDMRKTLQEILLKK